MATRRSNGEGTEITKGADGRWHASISFGVKAGGKRDRRHVSGASRADVAAKVRAMQAKRDAGLVPAAGHSITLAEWLNHWLDTIAPSRVRQSTLQGYRRYIENRIIPGLGHHRLDRLQPEHVEAFYAACTRPSTRLNAKTGATVQQAAMASASVLQCHRILSRALKVAMQRDRVARNVCSLVEAPSLKRVEIDPLTAEEARLLLRAAVGQRNAARWSVALALGLRQGEALGLMWGDIDLDRGTLTVRRALQRRTGQSLVLVEPKSRAGRRTIMLPGPLTVALKEHRREQLAERMASGELWEDRDFVFAQLNGRPIHPESDWEHWHALLKKAGVRRARLHDARHTAATLLMTQGVPARVAMQILGHSTIALTLGTYSHVVPELAADAAARMGSILWGDESVNGYRNGTEAPRS